MIAFKTEKATFRETPAYVDHLVARCTEAALRQAPKRQQRLRLRRRITAVAASAIIVLGVGLSLNTFHTDPPSTETAAYSSPLDSYLAHITDEEAQLMVAYEVEDFQEY